MRNLRRYDQPIANHTGEICNDRGEKLVQFFRCFQPIFLKDAFHVHYRINNIMVN